MVAVVNFLKVLTVIEMAAKLREQTCEMINLLKTEAVVSEEKIRRCYMTRVAEANISRIERDLRDVVEEVFTSKELISQSEENLRCQNFSLIEELSKIYIPKKDLDEIEMKISE